MLRSCHTVGNLVSSTALASHFFFLSLSKIIHFLAAVSSLCRRRDETMWDVISSQWRLSVRPSVCLHGDIVVSAANQEQCLIESLFSDILLLNRKFLK